MQSAAANRAEAVLQTAAKLSPLLSEPYIDLAVIALRRGQHSKALEFIEKAASLKDSYLVHLNKGDILSAAGRYAEAVHEYTRAVELRPDRRDVGQLVEKRLQHLLSRGLISASDMPARSAPPAAH